MAHFITNICPVSPNKFNKYLMGIDQVQDTVFCVPNEINKALIVTYQIYVLNFTLLKYIFAYIISFNLHNNFAKYSHIFYSFFSIQHRSNQRFIAQALADMFKFKKLGSDRTPPQVFLQVLTTSIFEGQMKPPLPCAFPLSPFHSLVPAPVPPKWSG